MDDYLEVLNFIVDNILDWNTSEDEDPWNKEDPLDEDNAFFLNPDVAFPDNPGVYIFKSLDCGDIYYIGETDRTLHERLKYKQRNDYTSNGYSINGAYPPSLIRYANENTIIHTISIPPNISSEKLEDVLLAAHKIKYGNRPEGNFSGGEEGVGWAEENPQIEDLLIWLAENVLDF